MSEHGGTKRNLTPRQKRVAENIRHYWHKKRTTEKITQTEFSRQMGWSHSIFGQYLNGRVAAGPTALFKLAEGLSVTPYCLDPELRGAFTPAPEDMHDLRASLQKMSADAVTGGAVPLHAASFRCDDGAMLCDIITEDGPAKLLAS